MLQACEVRLWVGCGALTKGCIGHLRGSTPGPLVVRGLVATERLLAPYLMTGVECEAGDGGWPRAASMSHHHGDWERSEWVGLGVAIGLLCSCSRLQGGRTVVL